MLGGGFDTDGLVIAFATALAFIVLLRLAILHAGHVVRARTRQALDRTATPAVDRSATR